MTIINVNSISGINSITAQGASGIEFYDSSGNSVHTVTSDTLTVGTGASVHNPASNVLTLGTNNEERIRIDSSGHVGIGTDAYFARLHIEDSSGELIRAEMTADTASGRITCIGGTASYAGINFGDRDDPDAGRIRYYNNDDHADLNKMLFYTDNAVQMRIDSDGIRLPNGNGIHFHDYGTGTNITSNLLDDYEEGTWTPTLNGAFTVAVDGYNKQTGYYTKIGRLVHAFCRIRVLAANLSSPTSTTIGVQGLPFTVFNDTTNHYPTGRGYGNLNANAENAYLIAFPNQTTAYFYQTTTDGYSSISGTNVGSADEIDYLFSITYQSE